MSSRLFDDCRIIDWGFGGNKETTMVCERCDWELFDFNCTLRDLMTMYRDHYIEDHYSNE